MEYLDFELPIKELHDQLEKCKLIGEESKIDVSETCLQILKISASGLFCLLFPFRLLRINRSSTQSVCF